MFAVENFTIYRRDMRLEKNHSLMSVHTSSYSGDAWLKNYHLYLFRQGDSGFKEEEYYDDTKFVNSRLTVFSCGELTAGMNLLGICIARDGQKRCCWRVLKA